MSSTTPAMPTAPTMPGAGGSKKTASRGDASALLKIMRGPVQAAKRVVLYGNGGVGKSTLASQIPDSLLIDLEGGTFEIDCARVDAREWTFNDLRCALQSEEIKQFKTVIIDTATKAVDIVNSHVCATGNKESLEDFGFGKGYNKQYEHFLLLLSDFDDLVMRGQNVVLIAHSIDARTPNPGGDDFLQMRIHLPDNKQSIAARTRNWADAVLPLTYDVHVDEGKAKGAGTRSLYSVEMPHFWAKGRNIPSPISVRSNADNSAVWGKIFNTQPDNSKPKTPTMPKGGK